MSFCINKWNEKNDILSTDKGTLLSNTQPVVLKNSPWAYSLNTAIGFYHKSTGKDFGDCDDLLFTTENGTEILYENVTVWPHNYFAKFMIVTLHETRQTIIIDSRGIPFEIDCAYSDYCYNRKVFDDKENGCFIVDNSVVINYRTVEEQAVFEEKTKAISGAVFNKEFNRFVRANAKNEFPYLYLTAGNSKCGIFIDYFIKNGMEYEIVPNMLCDDESVNLRIPLFGENLKREDVQYLCAKYENTYAIYNIPIKVAGGMFTPENKFVTYVPANKDYFARSIFKTFCEIFDTNDKNKIFQKTVSKIIRLFNKGSNVDAPNKFLELQLMHPQDVDFRIKYFEQKRDYIAKLLSIDVGDVNLDLYPNAYEIAKQLYKEEILRYETEIQKNIVSTGKQISRWKNESHLYELVVKIYPDAVYQYHSSWLGLQSLDIYIPSLSVGLEYQGEQHYRPIEFFGGEKAFEIAVERDKRKAKLCKANNVKLICWKYDEIITLAQVKKRIAYCTN